MGFWSSVWKGIKAPFKAIGSLVGSAIGVDYTADKVDSSINKVDAVLSARIEQANSRLTEQQVLFFKNLDVAITKLDSVIKDNVTHAFDELRKYTNEDLPEILKRVHAIAETLPMAQVRPIILNAKITKKFDGKSFPILEIEFEGYSLDTSDQNHIVFLGTEYYPKAITPNQLTFECIIYPKDLLSTQKDAFSIELYLKDDKQYIPDFIEKSYKNVFPVEFNNSIPFNNLIMDNAVELNDTESQKQGFIRKLKKWNAQIPILYPSMCILFGILGMCSIIIALVIIDSIFASNWTATLEAYYIPFSLCYSIIFGLSMFAFESKKDINRNIEIVLSSIVLFTIIYLIK
jgi:hypothetical protein